jgi:hypothetical protein
MVADVYTRKTKELCEKANLHKFNRTIKKIITEILDSGCKYGIVDIAYRTAIERSSDSGRIIRLKIEKNEPPIWALWKLLHEFGHYQSGEKKLGDKTMYREMLAWKYAETNVKKYPTLIPFIEDFYKRREYCLESYRKSLLIENARRNILSKD